MSVIHFHKTFRRWGGEGSGTLCNRMTLSDDGMNLSDVREEVTCKLCLRELKALDLRAVTPPNPLEPPQEIDWAASDDAHMDAQGGMGSYNPPPAHIDTTSPVVLKPELQVAAGVRPEFEVRYEVTAVIDHADFIQQVADDLADVQYVCVVKAQPNELAAAQIYVAYVDEIPSLSLQDHEICELVSSAEVIEMWQKLKELCQSLQPKPLQGKFNDWIDQQGYVHMRGLSQSVWKIATDVAREAWNAQQAKIDALEQTYKDQLAVNVRQFAMIQKQDALKQQHSTYVYGVMAHEEYRKGAEARISGLEASLLALADDRLKVITKIAKLEEKLMECEAYAGSIDGTL